MTPHQWPGDSVGNTDAIDYDAISSARLRKVLEYASSSEFLETMLSICISSLPRWHLTRSLDSEEPSTGAFGIVRGLDSFIKDCYKIWNGDELIAE